MTQMEEGIKRQAVQETTKKEEINLNKGRRRAT